MESPTETEVKIVLTNRRQTEEQLHAHGFQLSVPRGHEVNDVLDTPDKSLRAKGTILRLRQFGSQSVLTWKGPGQPGAYKSRTELETTVASGDMLRQIFEQLGYTRAFRYEKFRTAYRDESQLGIVTVDETPIGDFLEIEGPGLWIDTTASRLGFSTSDYILESYGTLYLNYCKEHGLTPTDMVFTSEPSGDHLTWQKH